MREQKGLVRRGSKLLFFVLYGCTAGTSLYFVFYDISLIKLKSYS